jgi:hypothetical protein
MSEIPTAEDFIQDKSLWNECVKKATKPCSICNGKKCKMCYNEGTWTNIFLAMELYKLNKTHE